MRILRPIQTNRKSQSFGEAKACGIKLIGGIQVIPMPINGVCPKDSKNLYTEILGMKGHNGEDWATWHGEPLYFPIWFPGAIWKVKTEADSAGGLGINIISESPLDIGGYIGYLKFKFWHLQKFIVHDDQKIITGQLLGFCDNTGLSGGDHLHWSMKKCDEYGNPLDRNNGYYGAMDFSPWFENEFIITFLQLKNAEAQIKTVQLTFIQILNKVIFLLREQIRKAVIGIGETFKKGR